MNRHPALGHFARISSGIPSVAVVRISFTPSGRFTSSGQVTRGEPGVVHSSTALAVREVEADRLARFREIRVVERDDNGIIAAIAHSVREADLIGEVDRDAIGSRGARFYIEPITHDLPGRRVDVERISPRASVAKTFPLEQV